MKSMNFLIKKAVILPLICISALCFGQSEFQSLTGKNNSKGSIEFVKLENNMLVFELNLTQLPPKGCRLEITNELGDVIFEKKITASSYKEIYRIERGNQSKINFEANGKNFRFRESFNLRFKIEEKLEVTKL